MLDRWQVSCVDVALDCGVMEGCYLQLATIWLAMQQVLATRLNAATAAVTLVLNHQIVCMTICWNG